MARKNLLKGLMEEATNDAPPTPKDNQRVDTSRPRYSGGAIGAVSNSIAQLKARSIVDIDPNHIDAGGLQDRISDTDDDHAALVESMREYGQQVPVLVRPHPEDADRYQVVYGRRRILAMRELGIPVKALVRDLDDRELVMAQGQENAARKDLSFIEKANFARQMRDLDYDRPVICAALHVDKTVISRMLSVVDRLPVEVIETIGSAPSVGRDRWLKLADMLDASKFDQTDVESFITISKAGHDTDKRFDAVFDALAKYAEKPKTLARKKVPEKTVLVNETGKAVMTSRKAGRKLTLSLDTNTSDGFDEWLIDRLPEIHRKWLQDRDG